MKDPIAITFADEKFNLLAQQQKENFNNFNIEHVTIPLASKNYNILLWIDLIDYTIEAIKKYKKIFRVDSEIRLLQSIPDAWKTNENVLFFINPICLDPWYLPINTGHMILSESSLPFLELMKTLILSVIPPNYNNEPLNFDDEHVVAPALELTKMQYHIEYIDYTRDDNSSATATRGSWYNNNTIFIHPFLHNWNTLHHKMSTYSLFRNHFLPNESAKKADAVLLGLKNKVINENYWNKLGFVKHDTKWKKDQWLIDPLTSSFLHIDYNSFKQPFQP